MKTSFKQDWKLRSYRKIVKSVLALEEEYGALSDKELRAKTTQFKQQLKEGKELNDLRIEAFAAVREAAYRVLGYRHFDVQLIGGLALVEGNVAEMKTGEGKTLTTTLAAYLRALEEKGVHIITVNEYLAERDCKAMAPIHEMLGLKVGMNMEGMKPEEKKAAYLCDITYGTGNEFGFDYLRDHHVYYNHQKVQRPFHYAIIDEIDSVLIDEGRTPLILAVPFLTDQSLLQDCQRYITMLKKGTHYEKEKESKVAVLTEEGISYLEDQMGISNLYDIENRALLHRLNQALTANVSMKKEVDYIVSKEGKIELIAPTTGRIMEGRSLSNGLHQAIEAKEGVGLTLENRTQSVVTLQHFYQKYPILAGLTGTAKTEERELYNLYGVKVVTIPTNKPVIREDHKDEIYQTKDQKYKAIVQRISEVFRTGRPVLVGTVSIEQSFELAKYLDETDIPFEVLNAHSSEHEAQLIRRAGQYGNVMIATNMAGRGTDILLTPETKRLGGLYVIGTERHESRRIDLQMSGRAGRQGEPGDSIFMTSLEDDLFIRNINENRKEWLQTLKVDENGRIIKEKKVRSFTDHLQKVCESIHYTSRDYMMKLNSVINAQRDHLYDLRNTLLDQKSYRSLLNDAISFTIGRVLEDYMEQLALFGDEEYIDPPESVLLEKLHSILPIETIPELKEVSKRQLHEFHKSLDLLSSTMLDETEEEVLELCRIQSIQIIDSQWLDLIDIMEHLQEGIHNNSYAQEQPLRAYMMEGHTVFLHIEEKLMEKIARCTASIIEKERREKEELLQSMNEGIQTKEAV
ncbi:preprotein translocase subunit SecA [Pseudobacillus badius]|uniref:preprotein translocase subunit SecA n=1 Tax=Bacillus badius TaxID=1455 RepID=UPI003D350F9B